MKFATVEIVASAPSVVLHNSQEDANRFALKLFCRCQGYRESLAPEMAEDPDIADELRANGCLHVHEKKWAVHVLLAPTEAEAEAMA